MKGGIDGGVLLPPSSAGRVRASGEVGMQSAQVQTGLALLGPTSVCVLGCGRAAGTTGSSSSGSSGYLSDGTPTECTRWAP